MGWVVDNRPQGQIRLSRATIAAWIVTLVGAVLIAFGELPEIGGELITRETVFTGLGSALIISSWVLWAILKDQTP